MKSEHVEEFNHDPWARDYDKDVRDESNPIRAGYGELLDWVASRVAMSNEEEILELGSGTGNLTKKLKHFSRVVCVDISEEMEKIAVEKLEPQSRRTFLKSDILEVFEKDIGEFDSVISTYTIHHLKACEKRELFNKIWHSLREGGIAVLGDLMFENERAKELLCKQFLREGKRGLVEDIEDEFFWDLESACGVLQEIGFKTEFKRFSELSFGIVAEKNKRT